MASEISMRAKTQTLSLRLDQKTRFILEFMSRARGQSITMIVERAIKEEADRVVIGPERDDNRNTIYQPKWSDFWDTDEGVRTLKLLANDHYYKTYDDEEIRQFTVDHWEFYYVDEEGTLPKRANVTVLWPHIQDYVRMWRESKSEDYWAVGKKMSEDLTRAKLKSPAWPRLTKPPQQKPAQSFARDLDDEVPF